jgi:hypothetical protein
MSDGKVLIAGGFGTGGSLVLLANSLEICNPAANPPTCTNIGANLSLPRGGHTAVLLSTGPNAGKALICGGQSAASSMTVTATCDIFDPADISNIYSGGSMVSPRVGHTATLLPGGKVFVSGGKRWNQTNADIYEPMCEMYNPISNTWTPSDSLNQGRVDHTATSLGNGLVLMAGGYNARNIIDSNTGRDEDVWTTDDTKYWGYGSDHQNLGSQGYLDGAELFDSKGGMMVVAEGVNGVAPYRTKRHSAMLLPDGTWSMFGGYGNIVRTVFSASPALAADTIIHLNNTGLQTADIVPNDSVVKFPLDIDLARPVSGRLVNADAFFSSPLDTNTPSVELEGSSLYMSHSTAALAGLPVGTLIPDPAAVPGDFTNTVQLTRPSGRAFFEMQSMTSDPSLNPALTVTISGLTFDTPLYPGDVKPCGGSVTGKVALTLPSIYLGITGRAVKISGTITDPNGVYSVSITDGGSASVVIANPASCDAATCVFVANITLPAIVGEISNLSAGTTIQTSGLNANGDPLSLSFDLYYTADEIHTGHGSEAPGFVYGRSDLVIREMIFSSALGFIPKENKWKDLLDTAVSPTLNEPVFDHTTLLTPAADTVVLGGRNCEASSATSCLAKTFNARDTRTVFIPVHRSANGSSDWQPSETLGSKRAYHTSTLLLNGQILTCGGSDGINPLATCELMDPATRKWGPTGSMLFSRTKYTATLLPNGTVLAAGGATSPGGATSAAEIYSPETGSWTSIRSMNFARLNHTATLLPNGNVLVAGGATLNTYSATSELYVTSAAVWQAAGNMTVGRSQHTATLLKNGNVLMTGGMNGFAAVRATDLYNFTTRTFTAGSDLKIPRYDHTANLLRDGRVVVIGGSDNSGSQLSAEINSGAAWAYTPDITINRANHRSVMLPNGKVMVTGGVSPGIVQVRAESYDPDFSSWFDQGKMAARAHHTSVLTRDNYIINIGGMDGPNCLDTTDIAYFSYAPDLSALPTAIRRQPEISTATTYFARGGRVTLLSGTSNFHGITEASGGGSGPMSSSHSNPRVYMQQIDNPSGFMIDLSTRIYSLYGGVNTSANWGRTLSSITVISPATEGELPYGYYHMRVAANGQFSEGQVVQVTIPRPTGFSLAPTTSDTLISSISVPWTWTHSGSTPNGFAVFNATSGAFVGFSTFGATGLFIQSGLAPNSQVAITVADYNIGGYGPRSDASGTYYTKAVTPANLAIDYANFDTVALSWSTMGNSAITAYELSAAVSETDPANTDSKWVVRVPFSGNHNGASAVLRGLAPNQTYFFRVRAINGTPTSWAQRDGERTGFSNHVSTKTIGNVSNLQGETKYPYSIHWSWAKTEGTPSYRIADITAGTTNAVLLSSAITNDLHNYTQAGLSPNTSHTVAVNAYDSKTGLQGPQALASLYTQAAQPYNGVIANPTPGSLTLSWESENPAGTRYQVTGSLNSDFSGGTTVSVLKSTDIPESSSFTWTGLTPSTRYYASVIAINEEGLETEPLSLGSAYTLPDTPTNLRAIGIAMSGLTLAWDTGDNPPDTTTYELRGSTTADNNGLSGYITTYLPFSMGQASNVFIVRNLMTSTTHYFDVSAMNAAGKATGRASSGRINTLDGPSGAPAGSIGGSSDPSSDVTISGKMPDNRIISLSVPAGAYRNSTSIAIAPSVTNSCSQNMGETPLVEVAVYTENNAQPQVPVTITINYLAADAAKITPAISRLVMGRYNPASGDCLPLETTINPGPRTITAKLNHFSLFQLINKNAATDLSAVRVYPNPYYTNRGQGFMTLDNMPASTEVRIYTLSGDKIWEGIAGEAGLLTWDATNSSGVLVASGVYLMALDSTGGKKIIKIAVER